MNRNIPETFDKNKEYYTKTPDNKLLFKYYFDEGSMWVCEDILLEVTYSCRVTDVVCTDEIFISKEEYEDLLLIQELKK